MLPQTIYCGKCKHILYNGMEIKRPLEVMRAYSGCCPKCSKKLNFKIEKVELIPIYRD